VTTPGTADSFLKASHVSRTQHAHQVTAAAALYVLMDKAYKTYREGVDEGEEPKSFSNWRKQAELKSPQFHYWSLTRHFQLTILVFVRSFWEGNFQLYKDACKIASAVVFCFRPHPLREMAARQFIFAILNVLKQKFQQ